MRRKPSGIKRKTGFLQLGNHVGKVLLHAVRQQKPVVQLGAPARDRRQVRLVPKARHQRAQQQLLHHAHAGVRRHLEGAQLQQAQAASA